MARYNKINALVSIILYYSIINWCITVCQYFGTGRGSSMSNSFIHRDPYKVASEIFEKSVLIYQV